MTQKLPSESEPKKVYIVTLDTFLERQALSIDLMNRRVTFEPLAVATLTVFFLL